MPTYVSLLRAINVSGRNPIAMADLRALYESHGHSEVSTYVQSGNVVSTVAERRPGAVARSIEHAIRDRFGFDVVVLVRTPAELAHVVAGNPFAPVPADATTLHVTFLHQDPERAAVSALDGAKFSPDEFVVDGREVYVHCPNGYGRTRANNAFFEKQLGIAATTRNWKTVNRLVELTHA